MQEVMHLPIRTVNEAGERTWSRCFNCWKKSNIRRTTSVKCTGCDKRFCIGFGLNSCFYEYHQSNVDLQEGHLLLVEKEEDGTGGGTSSGVGKPTKHLPVRRMTANGKPAWNRCARCYRKRSKRKISKYGCTGCDKTFCITAMGPASCFYEHHKEHYKQTLETKCVPPQDILCCVCSVPVTPVVKRKRDVERDESIKFNEFLLECFGEEVKSVHSCPEDVKILGRAKALLKMIQSCQRQLEQVKELLRKRKINCESLMTFNDLEDGMEDVKPLMRELDSSFILGDDVAKEDTVTILPWSPSKLEVVLEETDSTGIRTRGNNHIASSPTNSGHVTIKHIDDGNDSLVNDRGIATPICDKASTSTISKADEEDKLMMKPVVLLERLLEKKKDQGIVKAAIHIDCSRDNCASVSEETGNDSDGDIALDSPIDDEEQDKDVGGDDIDRNDVDWVTKKMKLFISYSKRGPKPKKTSPSSTSNGNKKGKDADSIIDPVCPILCDKCPKEFLNNRMLYLHSRQVHSEKVLCPLCPPDKAKKYQCIKSHIKIVHQNGLDQRRQHFMCEICGQRFSHPADGRKHMAKVHLKTYEKVSCNICGKKLSDMRSVRKHKRSQHLSDKKYMCSICGQGTLFISHLKSHVTKVHSGIEEDEVNRILDKAIIDVRRKENEAE